MKKRIGIEYLAAKLGVSAQQLKQELALIGWNEIIENAKRLAHIELFEQANAPNQRAKNDQPQEPSLRSEHVITAAKAILPDLNPTKLPQHGRSAEGYIYALYEKQTKLCKIGCTKSDKQDRQRAIISAHGGVLVNILNAKVSDRRAAEAQCHKHFAAKRTNGEWFNVEPIEVIDYISKEIQWIKIDCESLERLIEAGLLNQSARRI